MTETTRTPVPMAPQDIWRLRQAGEPQVSPTGSAIAFTVTDPDAESNRYRRRIWLACVGPDGGQPYPFTGQGSEHLPRWAPDGRRLAFVSSAPGDRRSEICVLPVAAGGERMVVCCWDGPVSDLA